MFTTTYKIEFYKVQSSMYELSIYLFIAHVYMHRYSHRNTSMLYKLLFSLPVTISSLVDERDCPKFLQLMSFFASHFFDYHHLIFWKKILLFFLLVGG